MVTPSASVCSHNSSSSLGSTDEKHDDPMNGLDVIMAIWGISLKATLRAAVHLGQDCMVNFTTREELCFGTVWDSYSAKRDN